MYIRTMFYYHYTSLFPEPTYPPTHQHCSRQQLYVHCRHPYLECSLCIVYPMQCTQCCYIYNLRIYCTHYVLKYVWRFTASLCDVTCLPLALYIMHAVYCRYLSLPILIPSMQPTTDTDTDRLSSHLMYWLALYNRSCKVTLHHHLQLTFMLSLSAVHRALRSAVTALEGMRAGPRRGGCKSIKQYLPVVYYAQCMYIFLYAMCYYLVLYFVYFMSWNVHTFACVVYTFGVYIATLVTITCYVLYEYPTVVRPARHYPRRHKPSP